MTEAMPKAAFYTIEEGGTWRRWLEYPNHPRTNVFAIMFENGRVWDPIVGWRPGDYSHRLSEIPKQIRNGFAYAQDVA